MLLESLNLTNYRQFESFQIEFDKRMTVLVGPNGSGKSAILDSAAIALATFFMAFDIQKKTIQRSDCRLVAHPVGRMQEARAAFPVRIEATGQLFGERLNWTRTLERPKGSTTRVFAKEMTNLSRKVRRELDEDATSDAGSSSLVLPLISYYGTGRLWSQKKAPKRGQFDPYVRESGYQGCLDASSDEKRLMLWMSAMDYAEYKEREAIPQYEAVCDILANLYSSISGKDNVSVSFDRRIGGISVRYREGEEELELPLSSLSDGYRTALLMMGDMAYRMCELNPQLGRDAISDTPGIVLIDEVDLHLHPKWQVRILRDLLEQFPRVQFIVTTHAPSVIASVDKSRVRMLNGDGEAHVPETQTYGRDASSIFREVMQAPIRQEDVSDLFERLYSALDSNNLTLARSLSSDIGKRIGANDPDLTAARTTLSLMGKS